MKNLNPECSAFYNNTGCTITDTDFIPFIPVQKDGVFPLQLAAKYWTKNTTFDNGQLYLFGQVDHGLVGNPNQPSQNGIKKEKKVCSMKVAALHVRSKLEGMF